MRSSLPDGLGMLALGSLGSKGVLHGSLSSLLLSLQGSLRSSDSWVGNFLCLFQLLLHEFRGLLDGVVFSSQFISEHGIVSAF